MINKLMKKYGYELISENEFGVYYEKQEPQNFTHVLCVIRKNNGKHLMQSYDKASLNVYGVYINGVSGVEIPILILMWVKAKLLKLKYNWK